MNKTQLLQRLSSLTLIFALLAVLIPVGGAFASPQHAGSSVVAYDMVGSASQNLLSHTNAYAGAFGSAGDGFEKYQRGISASIPFAVLDDSLSIYPPDSLGIIKEGNTDEFFGVVDTENSNNSYRKRTFIYPGTLERWKLCGASTLYLLAILQKL